MIPGADLLDLHQLPEAPEHLQKVHPLYGLHGLHNLNGAVDLISKGTHHGHEYQGNRHALFAQPSGKLNIALEGAGRHDHPTNQGKGVRYLVFQHNADAPQDRPQQCAQNPQEYPLFRFHLSAS